MPTQASLYINSRVPPRALVQYPLKERPRSAPPLFSPYQHPHETIGYSPTCASPPLSNGFPSPHTPGAPLQPGVKCGLCCVPANLRASASRAVRPILAFPACDSPPICDRAPFSEGFPSPQVPGAPLQPGVKRCFGSHLPTFRAAASASASRAVRPILAALGRRPDVCMPLHAARVPLQMNGSASAEAERRARLPRVRRWGGVLRIPFTGRF